MLSYARSGLYRFLEKEGENAALLFCQAGYRLKFRRTGTHGLEAHGTRGEKAMADVLNASAIAEPRRMQSVAGPFILVFSWAGPQAFP